MGWSWKVSSNWYLKWVTLRDYAGTFSFSFKAALHFSSKIHLSWKNKCIWAKAWNGWSIFLRAELPVQPLLPGGRDSQLLPGTLGHWRQVSFGGWWHELNCCCHELWWQGTWMWILVFSWSILFVWSSWIFPGLFFVFLSLKKFIVGGVSSTRAWVLWVGEYSGATRNQESIACLFRHACAGGRFSVYI